MTQPTARAVQPSDTLTNITVGFLQNQQNFVASRVFPNVSVQYRSGDYFVWDRGSFNRDRAAKRAPGTPAAEAGIEVSTASYAVDVWATRDKIPDQVRENAGQALALETAKLEALTQAMLIRKEKDWASQYFTTGVWGTDITGVVSSPGPNQTIKWSDQTSGTPIEDIRAGKTAVQEATGFIPNTLVVNQRVLDDLVDHASIIDRIKYSGALGNQNPARTSLDALAMLFEVDRVFVARGIENTAAEGAAESSSFIAGNNALLCYAAPAPGLMTPSAGYTFSWVAYSGTGNDFGVSTRMWYDNDTRSDILETEMAYQHKLVASELGYFFSDII